MARSQTDKLSGCNKDKTGLEARCPELGGGGGRTLLGCHQVRELNAFLWTPSAKTDPTFLLHHQAHQILSHLSSH